MRFSGKRNPQKDKGKPTPSLPRKFFDADGFIDLCDSLSLAINSIPEDTNALDEEGKPLPFRPRIQACLYFIDKCQNEIVPDVCNVLSMYHDYWTGNSGNYNLDALTKEFKALLLDEENCTPPCPATAKMKAYSALKFLHRADKWEDENIGFGLFMAMDCLGVSGSCLYFAANKTIDAIKASAY